MHLVFEDLVSLTVMEKLISLHPESLSVQSRINAHGFGNIRRELPRYNKAAVKLPFFVLTDLDTASCPPEWLSAWLPKGQAPKLLFRVAVREVVSWILADRAGFAEFLGISAANFKQPPDTLPDPKREIFRLTRKSRSRDLKEDILPGKEAAIGSGYNFVIPKFIRQAWSPERARIQSPSLDRALTALSTFATRQPLNAQGSDPERG